MRILFDQGTPAPLRKYLIAHAVERAGERGWSTFANGDLLNAAERAGFEALVTTDSNLRYQQNLTTRRIAIAVLSATNWPWIQECLVDVVAAIDALQPAEYVEIRIPPAPR